MALAREADVIAESSRPGAVDRLGVGYAAVRKVNPRIVYCSISAFWQTGPYAQRVAHDLSIQVETGVVSLTVGVDGRPSIPPTAAADMAASPMTLSGLLMALLRREIRRLARERGAQELANRNYWARLLGTIDVCWASVRGLREGLRSEQLAARKMLVDSSDGHTLLGIPIKFADEPGQPRPVAPRLGEHTRSVLPAAGFDDAELDLMAQHSAIKMQA